MLLRVRGYTLRVRWPASTALLIDTCACAMEQYFLSGFESWGVFFPIRKQFTGQLAVLSVLSNLFHVQDRFLERFILVRSSGGLSTVQMYPSTCGRFGVRPPCAVGRVQLAVCSRPCVCNWLCCGVAD